MTGGDGSFTCEIGKPVTFSIGLLQLPAVTCGAAGANVFTPLSVFDTADLEDVRVVNLARLLQTLDKNGNPDDGIEIDTLVASNADNLPADLDFSSGTFAADVSAFITDVYTADCTSNDSLVSANSASDHLQNQFTSIAGSWHLAHNGSGQAVFTFFSNGDYELASYGSGTPSGQDGMERGTYTWNAETGAFVTPCPTVDTDGQWGLSHGVSGDSCTGSSATVTVSGNTLTLSGLDDGETTFSRVVDATNPIVGAWSNVDLPNGATVVVTFLANGEYFYAEEGTVDPNGEDGIEHGTYTWNQSTGALITPCPTVDTNGQWGFSNNGLNHNECTGLSATATVTGNELTITSTVAGNEFTVTAYRVTP